MPCITVRWKVSSFVRVRLIFARSGGGRVCNSLPSTDSDVVRTAAAAKDVCEGSRQQVGKQLRKAAARQALRPNDLPGA